MGIFEVVLVVGVIWIAAIAVFVSIASAAGQADQAHDALVAASSRAPVQVVPSPAAEPAAARSGAYATLRV
jgi:hypothetical protein